MVPVAFDSTHNLLCICASRSQPPSLQKSQPWLATMFSSTMLIVALVAVVALIVIFAIVWAVTNSKSWHPSMTVFLTVGIAAVVIVAVFFIIFAVFATTGADELWIFLRLVVILLCGCCCLGLAVCGGQTALKAITN